MKRASSRATTSSRSTTKSAAKKQAGATQTNSFVKWCSNHELLCFAIVAAIWLLALYSNAMKAPFVYDDLDQIVNNPSLGSWHAMLARFFLSPVTFTTEFLSGGGSTYRPLFWLSLMVDRQIWGVSGSRGFHLTNLLLHWANGVVLFKLLRRFSISALTAAMASIVWLGLPINTEAVAWVSARSYLLSTFFILSALLFVQRYLSEKTPATLACCFALATAAIFSHEQGLILLPLTALMIYITSTKDSGARVKLTAAVLVADALYVAVKYRVGAHSGQGKPAIWSAGLVFWKYMLWIFAPVHMSIERSTSLPPDTPSLIAVIAWALMLALPLAALLLRRTTPVVAAGVVGGWVALLPFCGLVYIYQGMAERFLYFASIGFTLSIVSAAIAYRRTWKGITIAALLLWMTWSAWRLRSRVLDWIDPVSLYRRSLQATPKSPSLAYNLGHALRERGDLADALDAYQKTILLQPTYWQAFGNMGEIYAQRSEPAEAIKAYDLALMLQPDDASVVLDKAVALQQTGSNQLAEQQYKRAIALAPKYSGAYVDLGSLYVQEDREDEATRCFQKAIDNDPNDPTAYFDLAVMFQQKGRDEEALAFYKKVLHLKPDDPDTLLYMSKLHVQPSIK